MKFFERIARTARRNLRGLWRLPDFRRLWLSLTITAFGAQVTNLALPLTAALLLHATPLQMGILVALETLPFALVSLHAGVLLDRVRKLPIVITSDVSRGLALLSIPICAWLDVLSIDVLYAVGFFCGVQNVVGGAAYQVLHRADGRPRATCRGEREDHARRDVVGADRPRRRRRADPDADRAVRDRRRRA